jgi:hypothetical protein
MTMPFNVVAVANGTDFLRFVQEPLQHLLTLPQGTHRHVLAVKMENVEDIGYDGLRISTLSEGGLQGLEAAFTLVVDNDGLHVQHSVRDSQLFETRG